MTLFETARDARQVVAHDRFDAESWATTLATYQDLRDSTERMTEASWTAERGCADVFFAFLKASPRLLDDYELHASFRLNHQVLAALMATDAWAESRAFTVGDPIGSAVAVQAMADEMRKLYRKLTAAQEAADRAEAAREVMEARHAEADVEIGAGEGELADLAADAEAADEAADEALNVMSSVIAAAVDEAAGEALLAVKAQSESMSSWGVQPGEVTAMDPTERIALARRLDTERLRQVMKLMGRMYAEMRAAAVASRWDRGAERVSGLTLGNDLTKVLPRELVALAVPELTIDFIDRYDRRQLMQFEYQGHPPANRGAIVYVEDSSGTMAGQRNLWARALGLALRREAAAQGRSFTALVFESAARKPERFDLPASAPLDAVLDYAEFGMTGGTDFERPLGDALDILVEEHTTTGRTDADIVFVTDGLAAISTEFLDRWQREKNRLGFSCFGVTIGLRSARPVEAVSDFVTEITDLTSGSDLELVFDRITHPQQGTT